MNTRLTTLAALALTGTLLLGACGQISNQNGATGAQAAETALPAAWQNCTVGDGSASVTDVPGTGQDKDTDLTVAAFNGWDETFATDYLLKNVLEGQGYTVKVENFEAAPAFAGTAQGDIDFHTDVWLPTTHASYIKQYGNKLEPLGCWYDEAKNTIAVNEDSPARTIADLAKMGDAYDNKLVGIEAGAGLTGMVQDDVIPSYGLQDMQFVVSSTPAMLAEVDSATTAGRNIAVTLWRPHWAYSAYPMRDLEDPEGALGGAETITSAGRPGFTEDSPKAAQILRNFVLTQDQLADLENLMMSPEHFNGQNHEAAVAQWLEENPGYADDLLAGRLR